MKLSKELLNNLISITSNSAIACYTFIGKNEKILADKAATDIMRYELNKLDIKGKVVIGEGELDEAPMLFIGEKLGSGNGPEIDIAVDPVEGTNFVAKNLPGAITVLAISEKGNLFATIFFPLRENYPPFNEFSIINPTIILGAIDTLFNTKNISFKWPNDLLINGKKFCGILQEMINLDNKKFLIIGIGLNLISNPKLEGKNLATNKLVR